MNRKLVIGISVLQVLLLLTFVGAMLIEARSTVKLVESMQKMVLSAK